MPPTGDNRSDQQLIPSLNAGDADAFDSLYYRYRDRVLRLALRFTASQPDAQDVLAETFTYLFRKFPGFALTDDMTTFLYPVVRKIALALRRKRRGVELPDDQELVGFATPVTDIGQTRADLAAAMADLSPPHREAVLLRFVDDLTIEEIAAATGVPPGTVKSRLHHAIAAMRDDARVRPYFRGLTSNSLTHRHEAAVALLPVRRREAKQGSRACLRSFRRTGVVRTSRYPGARTKKPVTPDA